MIALEPRRSFDSVVDELSEGFSSRKIGLAHELEMCDHQSPIKEGSAVPEKKMADQPQPSLREAEDSARKRVNAWVAGAVAVGWVPGSMFALAAADVELCREVASCFCVKHWSAESVSAAVGASVTGKIVAGEALSFIPVVGWAVKAGVAGGITKAVGEAIIRYFRSQSPLH